MAEYPQKFSYSRNGEVACHSRPVRPVRYHDGGENEDIVSQSMDALESRLNGIQEAIQAERHLRTVSEERKKVERGKEILKLALSEV